MRARAPKKKTKASDSINFKALEQVFRGLKLATPVAEHRFHPTRKWLFDYAWPEEKVALEVEGGIWRKGGGAHSRPANIMRDIEKYNAATVLGWRVIRCTPQTLFNNLTIEMVRQLL